MRLLPTALWSSLLCAGATVAGDAAVYLYDPATSRSVAPNRVSPETARLIFAQRQGISQFHSLESLDKERLSQIEQYGGKPQQLLGLDDERDMLRRPMVVVEGVSDDAKGKVLDR